ncbi:hypothetical protein BH23VER1_BH23VER1_35880 [soil metagenome]
MTTLRRSSSPPPDQSPATGDIDGPTRPLGLARASISTGLASLTPVPFVDEMVVHGLRKDWVEKWLNSLALSHEKGAVDALVGGEESSLLSRAGKAGVGLAAKPVRKLFRKTLRKAFFWIAVRRASLVALETYLMGRSLVRAREAGSFASGLSLEESRRVAIAFRGAVRGIDRQLTLDVARMLWENIPLRIQGDRLGGQEVPLEPDLHADEAAQLRAAAQRNEVRTLFNQFDSRFDTALAAAAANGAAASSPTDGPSEPRRGRA